ERETVRDLAREHRRVSPRDRSRWRDLRHGADVVDVRLHLQGRAGRLDDDTCRAVWPASGDHVRRERHAVRRRGPGGRKRPLSSAGWRATRAGPGWPESRRRRVRFVRWRHRLLERNGFPPQTVPYVVSTLRWTCGPVASGFSRT